MFKKGDYIVVLKDSAITNNWENFVLKQTITRDLITPIITPLGISNEDCEHCYSDFKEKDDVWRYATPEEIQEYDRIGRPFNITTFKPVTEKEWFEQEKIKPDYTYLIKLFKKYGIK